MEVFILGLIVAAIGGGLLAIKEYQSRTATKDALQPFVLQNIKILNNQELAGVLSSVRVNFENRPGLEFEVVRRLIDESASRLRNSPDLKQVIETNRAALPNAPHPMLNKYE